MTDLPQITEEQRHANQRLIAKTLHELATKIDKEQGNGTGVLGLQCLADAVGSVGFSVGISCAASGLDYDQAETIAKTISADFFDQFRRGYNDPDSNLFAKKIGDDA